MDDKLYEKVGDKFAMLNSNDVKFVEQIEDNGMIIKPIPKTDPALMANAVILPTGVEEYESEEKLVEDIKKFILKYCDIDDEYLTIYTYYILYTWLYDRFKVVPYISFLGDTGTGKTRRAKAVGFLCYKPCKVAGAITPAPIYRMIKKWEGTIIIEEGDFRDSSEKNEVVTILNAGFESDTPVIRCTKDDPDNLQFFKTFCPKIIIRRKPFIDQALESRCITEQTISLSRDVADADTDEFLEEQGVLRNKLLLFRLRNYFKVNPNKSANIDLGEIEPRLKQAMKGFALLFVNIPELFEQFKRFLNKYNEQLILERQSSYDGEIVQSLFGLIEEGQSQISAKDIKTRLNNEKATPQSIGKILRSLGFVTKVATSGEKRNQRVLVLDDRLIKSISLRYGIASNASFASNALGSAKNLYIYMSSENCVKREGVPHSIDANDANDAKKTPKMENVRDFIFNLFNVSGQGQIQIQYIINSLSLEYDKTKVEELIRIMLQQGDIYESKSGHISRL